MRKSLMVILILLFSLSAVFADNSIQWAASLDEGLARARKTDQSIFLLITAPSWCGWCVKLEQNVLSRPEIIRKINEGFVPVKIMDTDSDVKRFQFRGYPTVRIIDADEKTIADVYTQDAGQMSSYLDQYASVGAKGGEEEAEGIQWAPSFDDGVAMAQEEGVPVFLLITAPSWCGWCVRLEENVLSKQEVIDYINQYYIPVKIMDTDEDVKRFKFRGFPTVWVMNEEGEYEADIYTQDKNEMLRNLEKYAAEEDVDEVSGDVSWVKKSDVAQYKGADWKNKVKRVNGISVGKAKQIAEQDPEITFFFWTKGGQMVLEGQGVFRRGDTVFFKGKPWYGSAPGLADAYEKVSK